MAYHFEKNMGTVQDGVRAIAIELIDDAVEATKQRRDAEQTVHTLRKTCKKLRGLVRLIQPVFAGYQAENTAFRDAGRGLSFLRDSTVQIATYDSLLDAFDDQVERARFAPVRRKLTLRHKRLAQHGDVRRRLEEFRETMADARRRVRHWRLDTEGFDAIGPGLAKTYKRTRRAMAAASGDISAEAIHEWRKRVKDHWYHSRLLTPVWTKMMKPHRVAADELGELLGQHHDLEVFKKRLAEDELADAADIKVLMALARRRQQALADQAFLMSARLLAERPKHLASRWKSYWQTWRSDEPREAALAA
jgi:CHAD domain-containing protein